LGDNPNGTSFILRKGNDEMEITWCFETELGNEPRIIKSQAYVIFHMETKVVPKAFLAGRLVDYCYKRYEMMYPLNRWMLKYFR
jgi:hypothetical protein